MMRRVAELIGTARPSPTPATAVFTPITRPRPSERAPPLLPGLRAASVWITLSMMRAWRPERAGSERPSADTTPAVTDPANPFGLPIATTSWPTRRRSASPSSAAVSAAPAALARHDVGAREHEPVGREHHAAAGARRDGAAAGPARHTQVGHRRRQPLGHRGHGLRVGVERLLLGGCLDHRA